MPGLIYREGGFFKSFGSKGRDLSERTAVTVHSLLLSHSQKSLGNQYLVMDMQKHNIALK